LHSAHLQANVYNRAKPMKIKWLNPLSNDQQLLNTLYAIILTENALKCVSSVVHLSTWQLI